jgi:uncharacterized membrane protein YhaH (DUF805 family)
MKYFETIFNGLRQTFTIRGRATRAEYWPFILTFWAMFAFWILAIYDELWWLAWPTGLAALVMFFSSFPLTVRRLHDANRSGWWMLLLNSGLGIAVLFIFALFESDGDDNRYGAPLHYRPRAEQKPVSPLNRVYKALTLPFFRFVKRHSRSVSRRIRHWRYNRLAHSTLEPLAFTSDTSSADTATILIHGTFARNAIWTEPDEVIASALRQMARRPKLFRFIWSGGNSHLARIRAAMDLRREIASIAQDGFTGIHLVGHSHGGTVALLANNDPSVSKYIKSATYLGTPFTISQPRSLDLLSRNISSTFSWLLIIFSVIGVIVLFGITTSFFSPALDRIWAIPGIMLFVITLLMVLAFALIKRPELRRDMEAGLKRYFRARQRLIAGRLRQAPSHFPAFVVSVSRDEARVWLRLVTMLSELPWLFISVAQRSLAAIFLTAIAAFFFSAGATGYFGWPDDAMFYTSGVLVGGAAALALSLTFAPLVFALYLWAVRGTRFGVGSDGVIEGLASRVSVTSLPPPPLAHGSRVLAFPEARLIGGLRHSSFYSDPALASQIADWIDGFGSVDDRLPETDGPTDAPPPKNRSRLAGIVFPALGAIAMIAAYSISIVQVLARPEVPQLITDPSPDGLRELEWAIASKESFELPGANQPYLDYLDLSEVKSLECELQGMFTMPNWATSVEVQQVRMEKSTEDAAGSEPENHAIIDGTYFRISDRKSLWFVDSKAGRKVAFDKSFVVDGNFLIYTFQNSAAKSGPLLTDVSYRCA